MPMLPPRHSLLGLSLCLCILGAVSIAMAKPSLRVTVNPKEISVGETVQLNVQAVTDGFRRGGGQPSLPAYRIGTW